MKTLLIIAIALIGASCFAQDPSPTATPLKMPPHQVEQRIKPSSPMYLTGDQIAEWETAARADGAKGLHELFLTAGKNAGKWQCIATY